VRGGRGNGRRPEAAWKSLRDSHRFHRPTTAFIDSIKTGKNEKDRFTGGAVLVTQGGRKLVTLDTSV
jgi:hypothetical protein